MNPGTTTTAVEAFRSGRCTHGKDGLAPTERIAGLSTLPTGHWRPCLSSRHSRSLGLVRPDTVQMRRPDTVQMRLCTRAIATGQAPVEPTANRADAADRQHWVWSGLTISRRSLRPHRRSLV